MQTSLIDNPHSEEDLGRVLEELKRRRRSEGSIRALVGGEEYRGGRCQVMSYDNGF
jgi:hypothetical protein